MDRASATQARIRRSLVRIVGNYRNLYVFDFFCTTAVRHVVNETALLGLRRRTFAAAKTSLWSFPSGTSPENGEDREAG